MRQRIILAWMVFTAIIFGQIDSAVPNPASAPAALKEPVLATEDVIVLLNDL